MKKYQIIYIKNKNIIKLNVSKDLKLKYLNQTMTNKFMNHIEYCTFLYNLVMFKV